MLNNLLQGVLMFDADAKLAFCNPRYTEMYGLSPDVAQPGCSLKELLGHQAAAGAFAEDPDEYIALLRGKMSAGETFADTLYLADGRIHSIVSKPIDGGGWLATHEDVTERQRSEERIAHMARHDALTDLPNRVLLRDVLEHELKRVKRGERWPCSVSISTSSRASTTRSAIRSATNCCKLVAERLRGCTREPDTVARLGGDEFAIIMTQMQQPTDAAALSRRIRKFDHQAVSDRRPPDRHRHQHRHFGRAGRRHRAPTRC